MNANATILTFLTISAEHEYVVFAFCKEVEDIAPDEIYWYPQRGCNNDAKYLWEEKKLKQWLLIGKDEDVRILWERLVADSQLVIPFDARGEVIFEMPKITKEEVIEGHVKIRGLEVCGRNEYPTKYKGKWTFNKIDISFLISEKNNCEFVSGYKSHEKITPVYPYGLLGVDSLFAYINDGVFAVYKKRGHYMTLRGDRNSVNENNDSTKYRGYIQSSFQFRKENKVQIRNIEGADILGEADIDTRKGTWEMSLREGASQGQFIIVNKETNSPICGEKFYLIKDIKIDTRIISIVFTDLFGREMSIGGKDTTMEISDFYWDARAAPDDKQSQIELSDKLLNILLCLGEKVTIVDPYFLGGINASGDIVTTISQKIFLNALITAIAKGSIKELVIVGYWGRAKKIIKVAKDDFIKSYKAINALINHIFKLKNENKLNKFELVLSSEIFHDRYWIGDSIMYNVSNSINGVFESGELKISKEDDLNAIKLGAKMQRRYDNGDKYDLTSK